MPPREQWESYFDPAGILHALGGAGWRGDLVEFGCGYGTFTIPAAQRASGLVHALDIDPAMVRATRTRALDAGLENVRAEERDFVAAGCGLASESAGAVLLFNILHIEDPVGLLKEAHRVLGPGGQAALIHWNHDARTPRGPSMSIRPRPEQCREWAEEAGFRCVRAVSLTSVAPWHWGMVLERPSASAAVPTTP